MFMAKGFLIVTVYSGCLCMPGVALALQRNLETPPDSALDTDFEAERDGTSPENPTSISDPNYRVITSGMPQLESQQNDIFMRYMPKNNVVLCGCGKCGSTSMLEYVYDQVFPQTWAERWKGKGSPYAQEVLSERWEGEVQMVDPYQEQAKIMDSAFSFALIRDPKERLVSAWKSKLACPVDNYDYGVDKFDRSHYDGKQHRYRGFVAHIQRLRGQDENITCMTLDMFAQALADIQRLNRSQYLDRHFLAQDLGCFYRFGPQRWSKVTTIREPGAFKELAAHLGSSNDEVPVTHSSPSKVFISRKASDLLDTVTRDEYVVLKPFLKDPSPIVAENWALIREPFSQAYTSDRDGNTFL